jgi:glycosyltransferase involved in cell wall biosynthesis
MKLLIITNTWPEHQNDLKGIFVFRQTNSMRSCQAYEDIKVVNIRKYKTKLLSYVVFYLEIIYNLKVGKHDRILVHQVTHCLFPFFFFKKKLATTYLHYHGFDLIPQTPLIKFAKWLLYGLIVSCKGYVFPSQFFQNKFQEEYGIDTKKCFVSYSGGISNDFRCVSPKRNVDMAFVGRIEEKKGVLEFLRVVERANAKNYNLNFHLHGYGQPFSEFKALYEKIDPKTLTVTLSNDPNCVPSVLKAASYFAFPSKYQESLGLVVLEALRSGCFILSSPQPSLSNIIINDRNGKFVDWEDEDGVLGILLANNSLDRKEISDSIEEFMDYKVNRSLFEWMVK